MDTNNKEVILYRCYKQNESGYNKVIISIHKAEIQSILDKMGGCINNKAGYNDQETADRIYEDMVCLQSLGYDHVHFYTRMQAPSFKIDWLEYTNSANNPDYCTPNIIINSCNIESIEESVKLFKRIKRTYYKNTKPGDWKFFPSDVMKILRRMRNAEEYDYVYATSNNFYNHIAILKGKPSPKSEWSTK